MSNVSTNGFNDKITWFGKDNRHHITTDELLTSGEGTQYKHISEYFSNCRPSGS